MLLAIIIIRTAIWARTIHLTRCSTQRTQCRRLLSMTWSTTTTTITLTKWRNNSTTDQRRIRCCRPHRDEVRHHRRGGTRTVQRRFLDRTSSTAHLMFWLARRPCLQKMHWDLHPCHRRARHRHQLLVLERIITICHNKTTLLRSLFTTNIARSIHLTWSFQKWQFRLRCYVKNCTWVVIWRAKRTSLVTSSTPLRWVPGPQSTYQELIRGRKNDALTFLLDKSASWLMPWLRQISPGSTSYWAKEWIPMFWYEAWSAVWVIITNPRIQDDTGRTPLHIAILAKNIEVLKYVATYKVVRC